MLSTSRNIQSLLQRAVDESAEVRGIDGELPLSPFLSGGFNLYRASVLGTSVLLAEDVSGKDGLPKRLEALEKALGEPAAVVVSSATASEKKALMASKQGFVTEQGDIYLPQLALVLKAEAEKKRSGVRSFSPAQQQAFLYCLLSEEELTQEGLREKTGMSAAGASRALSSLADARLIDYDIGGKTGRKRTYFVPDKTELFRRGRKLFGDPVKAVEKHFDTDFKDAIDSGLTALASRSELVAPRLRVVAVGPNAKISDGLALEGFESACVVQWLSYDPRPFAENGAVDPFTMLVTTDEEDERISMALREALGGYAWYTD